MDSMEMEITGGGGGSGCAFLGRVPLYDACNLNEIKSQHFRYNYSSVDVLSDPFYLRPDDNLCNLQPKRTVNDEVWIAITQKRARQIEELIK